jgi:hypothetical protein
MLVRALDAMIVFKESIAKRRHCLKHMVGNADSDAEAE